MGHKGQIRATLQSFKSIDCQTLRNFIRHGETSFESPVNQGRVTL